MTEQEMKKEDNCAQGDGRRGILNCLLYAF